MAIKAVIFDMDGVVVDSIPIGDKVTRMVLKKNGIVVSEEDEPELKKVIGLPGREVMAHMKKYFGLKKSLEDLVKERRAFEPDLVKNELRTVKGFDDFIKLIRKKYKTALASSAVEHWVEKVENKLSIMKNFDVVVTGKDAENIKPHPEPYLIACKKLGVKPSETVAIEDSIVGVKSAKAAGCICIGLTTSFEKELKEADYIAHNYREVGKIIEGLK